MSPPEPRLEGLSGSFLSRFVLSFFFYAPCACLSARASFRSLFFITQILYDNLLNPILNIGNPRADERIKYGKSRTLTFTAVSSVQVSFLASLLAPYDWQSTSNLYVASCQQGGLLS